MSVITAVLVCLLAFIHGGSPAVAIHDDDASVKHHWALLVAGSSGWGNYRHQADVAHAYKALTKGGFNPSRIIVMMQDDVANSEYNPYPGQLFNCPGCEDVYAGLRVDYRGDNVTAENVLAVLRGDHMHGIGNGRTLASGPRDRVLFYYSDHGAYGVVGMPNGDPLYADDLAAALKAKHAAGGFKELVAFVEACESGSMFQGLLSDDLPVFATTASNASESSWATYCPVWEGADVATDASRGTPMDLGTCLGDLYSVSFLELADAVDLEEWSLQKQFEAIRMRTSANHTYRYGSHAQEFGVKRISQEPSSDFEGFHAAVTAAAAAARGSDASAMLQHEADLVHLRHRIATGAPEAAAAASQELEEELRERRRVDGAVLAAAGAVLQRHFPAAEVDSLRTMHGGAQQPEAAQEHALLWLASQPARREGQPAVDSWDCLRAFVGSFQRHCGPLTTYAARHAATMAKLCNAAAPAASWDAALAAACE